MFDKYLVLAFVLLVLLLLAMLLLGPPSGKMLHDEL
jgi:hypothetical protein